MMELERVKMVRASSLLAFAIKLKPSPAISNYHQAPSNMWAYGTDLFAPSQVWKNVSALAMFRAWVVPSTGFS